MSLTDDWKAGKLKKNKNYFVRVAGKKKVYPARLYSNNAFSFCGNGTCYFPNGKQEIKVLAICDYDHFVELTEKVKGLEKDVENLTNNYKLLESKQAVDIAHGQALVDEFGDYEAVYQEIIRLKREVDKGDMIIGKLLNEGKAAMEKNKQLRQLLKECKEYLSDGTRAIVFIDNSNNTIFEDSARERHFIKMFKYLGKSKASIKDLFETGE